MPPHEKGCDNCLHNSIEPGTGFYKCSKGLNHHGCVHIPCNGWELDRPHVAAEKPTLGCSPYYVSASARICELCEAIKRASTQSGKHNQIKLWVAEIQYLNEMDRMLRRVESEKTWVEEKDGTLKEVE